MFKRLEFLPKLKISVGTLKMSSSKIYILILVGFAKNSKILIDIIITFPSKNVKCLRHESGVLRNLNVRATTFKKATWLPFWIEKSYTIIYFNSKLSSNFSKITSLTHASRTNITPMLLMSTSQTSTLQTLTLQTLTSQHLC